MLRSRFEAPHARIWAKQRATFDHVIPRSKGGPDTPANLQLAHARCNKIKGGAYPSTGSG
ncbi:MAG: HNH endonuclease [Henriciella sp.]|nr:HNH endonuclease [Henriciella sp.]